MTNDINIMQPRHSIQELKEMQSWDLEKKIQVSLAKIAEFNTKMNDKTYILLFSFLTNIVHIQKLYCLVYFFDHLVNVIFCSVFRNS